VAAATGRFFDDFEVALGADLAGVLAPVLALVLAGAFAWLRDAAAPCALAWDRAGVATPAITRTARTGSKRNKVVFIPIRPLSGAECAHFDEAGQM
jgi:hypothetical protein